MTRFSPLAFVFLLAGSVAAANEGHNHAPPQNGQVAAPDMAAEFARLDANHDGQLSRAELPRGHRLALHFGMLDADRNGTLSAAEFAQGRGM